MKTSTYHRFSVAQAHNISMATGGCVWPFMVASRLKKKSLWCSWYYCVRGRGHSWWNVCLMSGGCGREDGGWRRTYHFFIHRWVWLLCVEKWWKKKSQCIWGRAVAEGEFAAVEMCVSLKAAMGMPDESTIFMCWRVGLFLCEKMGKENNCNVSAVVRWQRKHSRWLKCMFQWTRPWEWWSPMEMNRPLSCLFVFESARWKWAWLIFLISCFSHEGGI